MAMPGRSRRRRLGHGPNDHELGLMDAFQAAKLSGQVLKILGRTAERDQFHAQVVSQVDVHRGHHQIAMFMLNLDHPLRQV
jgi:hypothetical protein